MFFFPGVSLNGSYPTNKQNFRCQKHPTSFLPSFSPLSRSPHAGSAAPDGEPDVAAKSLGAPPSSGRESAWVRPAAHGELEGFNGFYTIKYHKSNDTRIGRARTGTQTSRDISSVNHTWLARGIITQKTIYIYIYSRKHNGYNQQ